MIWNRKRNRMYVLNFLFFSFFGKNISNVFFLCFVKQEPSSMATIQAINETNVDDEYFDEKEALESFDRIIEEESKLINETDILREEELIELKERCIKLNDDNIALRREVDNLRLTSNKQFQLLLYTASLAAFIGYLLSFFFS